MMTAEQLEIASGFAGFSPKPSCENAAARNFCGVADAPLAALLLQRCQASPAPP